MEQKGVIEKRYFRGDLTLLFSMLLLFLFGLVCMLSASLYRSEQLFDDPFFLFRRHLVWSVLGGVLALLVYRIKLTQLERYLPWILVINLILLLLTFVDGVGVSYLGARRWISVGAFTFQPSELVKLSIVLYLAVVMDRKRERLSEPWHAFIPPLIVVGVFAGLIYLQNDFSTALLVMLIAIVMFFIGRVPLRYFLTLTIGVLPIIGLLLLSRLHRVERLLAYLIPTLDPQGSGFQVLAAEAALRRGGFWGVGGGRGIAKNGALPEAHADFIFATVSEEYGVFGGIGLIALFGYFLFRSVRLGNWSRNGMHANLHYGIAAVIVLQALVNIAINCRLLPPTGITLPFFSAGGSSLVVTIVMCALLLNVSRYSYIPSAHRIVPLSEGR